MSTDSLASSHRPSGARTTEKRLGRGVGSGLGKTCGPRPEGPEGPPARQHQQAALPGRPDADPAPPAEARLPQSRSRQTSSRVNVGALERFAAGAEGRRARRSATRASSRAATSASRSSATASSRRSSPSPLTRFSQVGASEKIEKAGGKAVVARRRAAGSRRRRSAQLSTEPRAPRMADLSPASRTSARCRSSGGGSSSRWRCSRSTASASSSRLPGVDRNVMQSVVEQAGRACSASSTCSPAARSRTCRSSRSASCRTSRASIIMQLSGMVSSRSTSSAKRASRAPPKIEQYTRYGTIVLSLFQGFGVAMMLEGMNNSDMGGGRSATS